MNPMNPFQDMEKQSFFGKHLIDSLGSSSKKKPWNYGKMKAKQIAKRRKHNKMAAASRRVNRVRDELNKGTKREGKKS
jgi:hypothetical protein